LCIGTVQGTNTSSGNEDDDDSDDDDDRPLTRDELRIKTMREAMRLDSQGTRKSASKHQK